MNAGAPGDHAVLDEVTGLAKRLRLKYLREAVNEVVNDARSQRWDHAETLRVLLAAEAAGRARSSMETKRRKAGFPSGKTFDAWDADRSSIPAKTQRAIGMLEWVARGENLVVAGPSGTGKSHFLEAVGHNAIEAAMSVAWFSLEQLGALVRRHRVDDTVAEAFDALKGADLTIVDDIGLLPISPDAAEGFYRLVDSAYEQRSIAVSSNLHPSGFDQIMDKTIALVLLSSPEDALVAGGVECGGRSRHSHHDGLRAGPGHVSEPRRLSSVISSRFMARAASRVSVSSRRSVSSSAMRARWRWLSASSSAARCST